MADIAVEETRSTRIYAYIGTRAQAIKMAPVVLECQKRNLDCVIVNTGQHGGLPGRILNHYGLSVPEITLGAGPVQASVETLSEGLTWLARMLRRHVVRSPVGPGKLFPGWGGVALVHGDTASTLLSIFVARRAKQHVSHIEAGLRSWNWLHPFPEELIRVAAMRFAHSLFAPNPQAYRNLRQMGMEQRARQLPANTLFDAIVRDLGATTLPSADLPNRYALATIHRMETLYHADSLKALVELLQEANRVTPLIFIEHPATARRLERYRFRDGLSASGIRSLPLVDHQTFLQLMRNCRFVITDGGSVQEEAYFLGVPCMLYRDATERSEGLDENVVLVGRRNCDRARDFLENYEAYRRPDKLSDTKSPSAALVDGLLYMLQ